MMTKEEIIDMAQRCGLFGIRPYPDGTYFEALEGFAKLVAKKEREECAKVCDAMDSISDYYTLRVELVCAQAIRARGQE